MKKWIERISLPFVLIGGYGLMGLVYLVAILAIGYLFVELALRTIEEPSAAIIAVDVIAIGALIFLVTRRRVREAFAGFWKQILGNM